MKVVPIIPPSGSGGSGGSCSPTPMKYETVDYSRYSVSDNLESESYQLIFDYNSVVGDGFLFELKLLVDNNDTNNSAYLKVGKLIGTVERQLDEVEIPKGEKNLLFPFDDIVGLRLYLKGKVTYFISAIIVNRVQKEAEPVS